MTRAANLHSLTHLQVFRANGTPKRAVVCAKCDHAEVFTCDVDRPGQALKKATDAGWFVKGQRCVCPACVAAERDAKHVTAAPPPVEKEPATMLAAEPKPSAVLAVVAEAPREPTIEQRRSILLELEDSYDRTRGRYCGGETDATVAKRVGGVPIAWVAQVRELMFGESGENDEMDDLLAAIERDRDELAKLSASALKTATDAETVAKRLGEHALRVDALRKAVGPRGERV